MATTTPAELIDILPPSITTATTKHHSITLPPSLVAMLLPEQADTIQLVCERIVRDLKPLSIILFGSMARGDYNKYSDIDIMIVMPEGTNTRVASLSMSYLDSDLGMDVNKIVETSSSMEKYSHLRGSVQRMALLEGVELYSNYELKYDLRHTNDMESGAQFMEHALRDLQTAIEFNSSAQNQIDYRAYASQQATEKALKAALAWSEIEPIHTHKLVYLYSMVPTDWGIKASKSDLGVLTEMNQEPRYGKIPVAKELADRCFDVASSICDTVIDEATRRGLWNPDVARSD